MENKHLCQSCGMPMTDSSLHGTEVDGNHNEEYCVYCYKEGAFTMDATMDEMIEHNLKFLDEFNGVSGTKLTEEQARTGMRELFPTLKRWAK